MTDFAAKIRELELRIAKLESTPRASSPGGGGDTLPVEKLTEQWADKEIAKVSSTWKHRNVVGLRYSDLSEAEALDLAGFFEWKAKKGREEVPVRMNNAGKPWHESDSFTAKLLRTWAKQKATNPDKRYGTSGHGANAKHTAPPERDPFDADNAYDSYGELAPDDNLPF